MKIKIPNWIKIVIGAITAIGVTIISFLTFREIEKNIIRKKWKRISGDKNHIMVKKTDGKWHKVSTWTKTGKIDPDYIVAVGITDEGDNNEKYHFKIKHIAVDRHNSHGDSNQSMDI